MRARWRNWLEQAYGWVRSQDLVVLILVLGVVCGLWAFIHLAGEVAEGDTRRLDERLIRALRRPDDAAVPIGPTWLPEAVRDITALGSGTVLTLVTAAVAGFVAIRRQYHALWLLLAALGGGVLLDVLLKGWFARPRPELVPHLLRVTSTSFPSGHSLLSAVVYLTLGALLARLVEPMKVKLYVVCVALFFAFLVGVSRIYLGVHYPTDVLAGWMVGLMWAVTCWLAARKLQNRGAVEGPR